MCHLHGYVCGFISKDDVKNIPLIGKVAQQIHCLFVKREDAQNRTLIVK
jgi:1-acyl-sn-glycerol-3-phosphate acyltransferase